MGFRKDGRITAIDMYTICDNGPYDAQGDARSAADTVSLAYQPETMRWRGITVLTNTPPKTSQRAPGGMQGIGIMEPIISKAAREARARSGRDPQDQRAGRPGAVRSRRWRPDEQAYVTSAFVKEALDKGAEHVQLGGEEGRARAATHGRARRCAASASPSARTRAVRSASTVCSSSSRTAACSSSRASATSARTRCSTCTASAAEMLGVPVGAVRRRVRQHEQEPAVDLRLGRQPDDARDDARGARGGDRRDQEAAGDRREDAWRQPGGYKVADGRVSGPGGSMTLRAGGAEGDRARRQVRRPRSCRRTSTTSRRRRRRRSPGRGLMAVAQGQRIRATARRSPTSSASRRWKSTSKRASSQMLDYAAVGDVGHGHEPAQPQRTAVRRIDARHRPRDHAALGLRPALRRRARAGGSTTTSRRRFSTRRTNFMRRRRRHSGSGDTGRRTRRRRAAGRRGLRRGAERDRGRASATRSSASRRCRPTSF